MIHLNKTGNWYVLADEPHVEFNTRKAKSVGQVDERELTQDFLDYHAEQCLLYRIPMYFGYNEELDERCKDTLIKIKQQLCQKISKPS